jgi:hypothetical protein
MDKDINRIKVVLAEKEGAARLLSVSWRDTKEPISGWLSSWDVPLLQYPNGVLMTASQQWKRI